MERRNIAWRDQAKAQLRAIEQPTALRILHALAHFAATASAISAEPRHFKSATTDVPSIGL